MPEIKNTFMSSKMNKDLDERLIPKGEYRDAMNIQVSTSEGSDVGTVQNILGNSVLTSVAEMNSEAVGSITDEKNNSLYWLISGPKPSPDTPITYNLSNGTRRIYKDHIIKYDKIPNTTQYVFTDIHTVDLKLDTSPSPGTTTNVGIGAWSIKPGMRGTLMGETDTGTIVPIFDPELESPKVVHVNSSTYVVTFDRYFSIPVLPANISVSHWRFAWDDEDRCLDFHGNNSPKGIRLITGINIIDDLLFWTDNNSEPKKIKIKRCIAGTDQGGNSHTKLKNENNS